MGYPPQGITAGVTKLSELTIDCSKDWQAYGITNLKELAAGMGIGYFLAKDPATGVLVGIPPGTATFELFTKGAGNLPKWDSY